MMKPVLFSALFGLFFLSVSGQPAQGTWMLGGDARFQTNVSGFALRYLALSPRAGYFVTDRLALGMGAGFSLLETDETEDSHLHVSPFARYYFPSRNAKLAFLLEAGGSFGFSRVNNPLYAGSQNEWRVHASGGVSYFLSPAFALEATLGAVREFRGVGGAYTKKNLLDFNLGFQVFLHRKNGETDTPTNSEALRKGSFLLGVSQTLSLNSDGHNFEPTFSYLLSDHIAVGAAITLPINEFRPYVRYFTGSKSDSRLRPYMSAGSSLSWEYGENSRFRAMPFADAGLLYFISPHLAIEGALQYQFELAPILPAIQPSSILMARVGFQYVLPRKSR